MKKIFILPILIAPIVAHATDPVGPAAVGQGETPVIASADAPFATAGAEIGDNVNVVTASYVKGAYNDAIAAVNKVNAVQLEIANDFENRFQNMDSNINSLENEMVSSTHFIEVINDIFDDVHEYTDSKVLDVEESVLGEAKSYTDSRGVLVYKTWGNDTTDAVSLEAVW